MEAHKIPVIADSSEEVPQRSRQWLIHFFQYTLVGIVSAAFDLAVFALMAEYFYINYLVSTSASFITGTTINFLICIKFVFRLNGHSWIVASWRKLLAGLAALMVNLCVMFVLVDIVGFSAMHNEDFVLFDGLVLARAIAIGAGFFLNFLLTKYYAFRDY